MSASPAINMTTATGNMGDIILGISIEVINTI